MLANNRALNIFSIWKPNAENSHEKMTRELFFSENVPKLIISTLWKNNMWVAKENIIHFQCQRKNYGTGDFFLRVFYVPFSNTKHI